MALVIPYRFIESENLSKLEVVIEDDHMTGEYRPPLESMGGGLDSTGLTEGASKLEGNVVSENEYFVVVRGRWYHIEGDDAEGSFQMTIETQGFSAQGWWTEDGDPQKHDWTWAADSRRKSTHGDSTYSPLIPDEERGLQRCGTSQRNFNRRGSVVMRSRTGSIVRSRRGSVEDIEIETLDQSNCCFPCMKFATSIWLIRYSLMCAELFLLGGILQLISKYDDKGLFPDIGDVCNCFYTVVSASYVLAYISMPKQPNWLWSIAITIFASVISVYFTYVSYYSLYSPAVWIAVTTVLSVAFIAFCVYGTVVEPTNAVYVSGVILFTLSFGFYFVQYFYDRPRMYILGSALSLFGSIPLTVSTWPTNSQSYSPFRHESSLFWSANSFTIGSVLFLLDSLFLTLPMYWPYSYSKLCSEFGVILFVCGRTYSVWGVTSMDCDLLFRRHQPKKHRKYKSNKKRINSIQNESGNVVGFDDVLAALDRSSGKD
jgi:hypothetical protein